jgi:hypothetical protein
MAPLIRAEAGAEFAVVGARIVEILSNYSDLDTPHIVGIELRGGIATTILRAGSEYLDGIILPVGH